MTTRKFNSGRLGEQLMNNDLFLAYNRIKYIGNGIQTPVQQYQTPILDYSLWIDRQANSDVMKSYSEASKTWKPMFEGYYHPASLLEQPQSPIDGQLYIDMNGVLRYYENGQWKVVTAIADSNLSNTAAAGTGNFLILPDMMKISGTSGNFYTVPLINVGKLFDGDKYVLRSSYKGSGMNVEYAATGEPVSWVHVNPSFMQGVVKRFIKVLKKEEGYFINVTNNNTEFYGFKMGQPVGTLLRCIETYEEVDPKSDYRKVSGGIKLTAKGAQYDFIYAITYKFDSSESSYGQVLTDEVIIGDNNEMFVQEVNDFPLVFLNGTYLEQDQYSYNNDTGLLKLESDDLITETMDIVVAAFANIVRDNSNTNLEVSMRPPFELTAPSDYAKIEGNDIVATHNYLNQVKDFKHPVAFVQGVSTLYDPDYGMTDEIIIDGTTITIKDFGPNPTDDAIGIMIADIGDAFMTAGVIKNDNKIVDDNITLDKSYFVFLNGICLSPSDLEIYEGHIEILGSHVITGEDNKYILLSLDEGDDGVIMMFDSSISYFTIPINDYDNDNNYDDCNTVVAYVSKSGMNGVLIDLNHVEKAITGDEAYSTGEIVRAKDEDLSGNFTYEYKIYNANGDYTWTEYKKQYGEAELTTMSSMITQFNTSGSLNIMSNPDLKGAKLEYYAYTFADEVDEPILTGRGNCKIAFKNHAADAGIPMTQDFSVSKMHSYSPINKGILSVYVNGIQVSSVDSSTVDGRFTIDTPITFGFEKDWGSHKEQACDLYHLLKEITDETSLVEFQLMRNGEYADELSDYTMTVETLEKFKSLARVIKQTETENELFYFVERMEQGESYSVNRDWLAHGNRFTNFDNTYASPTYYGVGFLDVYVNGVMIDKSDYSFFNNNYVMFNNLMLAGGSDEYDIDNPNTHNLIKYYVSNYNPETGQTNGKMYKVHCESPDEVLVEFRPDITLRKTSYAIKDITYDMNGAFPYEDYEFPASLLNTKDAIKVWIDGILYTGKYSIQGKDITLDDCQLNIDPIREYFNSHPDTYRQWKNENGEYSSTNSRVIFEWR